jgi:hypothetical protein
VSEILVIVIVAKDILSYAFLEGQIRHRARGWLSFAVGTMLRSMDVGEASLGSTSSEDMIP